MGNPWNYGDPPSLAGLPSGCSPGLVPRNHKHTGAGYGWRFGKGPSAPRTRGAIVPPLLNPNFGLAPENYPIKPVPYSGDIVGMRKVSSVFWRYA